MSFLLPNRESALVLSDYRSTKVMVLHGKRRLRKQESISKAFRRVAWGIYMAAYIGLARCIGRTMKEAASIANNGDTRLVYLEICTPRSSRVRQRPVWKDKNIQDPPTPFSH